MRRSLALGIALAAWWPSAGKAARGPAEHTALDALRAGWASPARTFRPHTRWWWPGSAVTPEGITWQLGEMKAQGMGGVEIMIYEKVFPRGNIPFMSEEWLGMFRHTVLEAKRLDLDVSLTLGAGWVMGGYWIRPEHRSQSLHRAWVDVAGPAKFAGPVPQPQFEREGKLHRRISAAAARLDDNGLVSDTLQELAVDDGGQIEWNIPDGKWRVMAFWSAYTEEKPHAQTEADPEHWAVNHLDRAAVRAHLDFMGDKLRPFVGAEFGITIDSLFGDSFECTPLRDGVLWSDDVSKYFKSHYQYPLWKALPFIWWEGDRAEMFRYDWNECLHKIGMDSYLGAVADWCAENRLEARIQPHSTFVSELIEASGRIQRPETERNTRGFATLADPRKSTAAGARFYGRDIVSAEAFTRMHADRYRETLGDIKVATDSYLRDGVTQFYNHGFFYTPEKFPAPTRDVPWPSRIGPTSTWWPHYKLLADYTARSSFMLRQGRFVGDVLLYSPQATVWARGVVLDGKHRRMPYGKVGEIVIRAGFDYDPINDDLLQREATVESGEIAVAAHRYRFLVLPGIEAMPVETMRIVSRFAESGGIVILLGTIPRASVGLQAHEQEGRELRALVANLMASGTVYHLPEFELLEPRIPRDFDFNPPPPPLTAQQLQLVRLLRGKLRPDLAIAGKDSNDALTYLHRRVGELDVYFVSNAQPAIFDGTVEFRTVHRSLAKWDPVSGHQTEVSVRSQRDYLQTTIRLQPFESMFFIAQSGADSGSAAVMPGELADTAGSTVIDGPWQVSFPLDGETPIESVMTKLVPWTTDPRTRHFSGTAVYSRSFHFDAEHAPGVARTLDLGSLASHDVAEAVVNGQNCGRRFMPPYRFEITHALRAGENRLEVRITNPAFNRVAGWTSTPEMSREVAAHYGDPPGVKTKLVTTRKRWNFARELGSSELIPSGLLGPVVITTGSSGQ